MFSLNAWFEKFEPNLELRNNYTNKVILSLSGEELCEALHDYGLAYTDLLENSGCEEVIRSLLLVTIKDYSKSWKVQLPVGNNIIKFPAPKKATDGRNSEINCGNVIYMNRFLTDLFL